MAPIFNKELNSVLWGGSLLPVFAQKTKNENETCLKAEVIGREENALKI
jgi:hypothetical protein